MIRKVLEKIREKREEKNTQEQQLSPDVVVDEVKDQIGLFLKDFDRSKRDIEVDRVADETLLNFEIPLVQDRFWVAVEIALTNLDAAPKATIRVWDWDRTDGLGDQLAKIRDIDLASQEIISELDDALDRFDLDQVSEGDASDDS